MYDIMHYSIGDKLKFTRKYILCYLNIYLTKGASYNIAGDGPTQWDLFVNSGIILSNDPENVYVGMHNNGDGYCFYYSILQLQDLFSHGIVTVSDLRFAIWYFVINQQYEICKESFEAFRDSQNNYSYAEYIESIRVPNQWACTITIIITSIFLQTDIILITNELSPADGTVEPGYLKTSSAFRDLLNIENNLILPNDKQIYLYQHMYEKPLQPAPLSQLNHFCACEEGREGTLTLLFP
jgi:hypothetical protein